MFDQEPPLADKILQTAREILHSREVVQIEDLPGGWSSIYDVLKAMEEEMGRSMKRLQLESFGPPYFLAYRLTTEYSFSLAASYGATTARSRGTRNILYVEARYGHKRGEDDGCFAAALASVRQHGGVLEHPAHSLAWPRFDLPAPLSAGWLRTFDGGFVAHVEQGHYGHPARKATWLYAFGVRDLPALQWGKSEGKALVSWMNNHGTQRDTRPRVGKKAASTTPPTFRDVLLAIARSVPQ